MSQPTPENMRHSGDGTPYPSQRETSGQSTYPRTPTPTSKGRITPKRETPETARQAQTWDTRFNAYKAAGFCPRCASQAAWGHQLGFNNTQPVGDCCRSKTPPRDLERAVRWANAVESVAS